LIVSTHRAKLRAIAGVTQLVTACLPVLGAIFVVRSAGCVWMVYQPLYRYSVARVRTPRLAHVTAEARATEVTVKGFLKDAVKMAGSLTETYPAVVARTEIRSRNIRKTNFFY
jgi:hypothetical protein